MIKGPGFDRGVKEKKRTNCVETGNSKLETARKIKKIFLPLLSQLWTDSSYPAWSRFDEIQFTRLSQINSFRIQWEESGHFLKWSSDRPQFFLNTVMVMLKFLADFEGVNIFTHIIYLVVSSKL